MAKAKRIADAARGRFVTEFEEFNPTKFKVLPKRYGKKENKGAFFILEGEVDKKTVRIMCGPTDTNEWVDNKLAKAKVVGEDVEFDNNPSLGWDGTSWIK